MCGKSLHAVFCQIFDVATAMRAKRSRAGTTAPPLAIFPPVSPDDLETPIGKKILQGRGFPKIKTWQLLVKDLHRGICSIQKGRRLGPCDRRPVDQGGVIERNCQVFLRYFGRR